MKNTLPSQGSARKKGATMCKNLPFLEARKIVESYIGTKTFANVVQKTNQKPQDTS